MNLAILWRLELEAWRLWPLVISPSLSTCLEGLCRGSCRLGAWSFLLLIKIFGPKRSQALLMILSSAAIVDSWAGDAWLTSIVNFFILHPLLVLRMHKKRDLFQPCPWSIRPGIYLTSHETLLTLDLLSFFPFIVSAGPGLPPRTGVWFHKFIAPGNHQTRARLNLTLS